MVGRVRIQLKYVVPSQLSVNRERILEFLLNGEGVVQDAGVSVKAERILQGWPPVMLHLDSGHFLHQSPSLIQPLSHTTVRFS